MIMHTVLIVYLFKNAGRKQIMLHLAWGTSTCLLLNVLLHPLDLLISMRQYLLFILTYNHFFPFRPLQIAALCYIVSSIILIITFFVLSSFFSFFSLPFHWFSFSHSVVCAQSTSPAACWFLFFCSVKLRRLKQCSNYFKLLWRTLSIRFTKR